MPDAFYKTLTEFIETVKGLNNKIEYTAYRDRTLAGLTKVCGPSEQELIESLTGLTDQYIESKTGVPSAAKSHQLTETEMQENETVQMILDRNLLTYHFQPIVRADSGEIYAYEALMRAESVKGISPFHILKYAELTGRLSDVEDLTFMNVLSFIKENSSLFGGKAVFINSLPKVRLPDDKVAAIEQLIRERPVDVVVEMTENSEFQESEIIMIKERFRSLGVPIAIDDFGTGYSNFHNLIRYSPNIVKIDRSLLSGIESNPNKKHVVREIIDFCHENGIMALAEGVETSDELRTVILMGADLIQGYYTAMPSPEIIKDIPYSIRAEICAHTQEREDGRRIHRYIAEKDERISLEYLNKDGYSRIHIGAECSGSTITVAGAPRFASSIHITTADGFRGTIVLENAGLSNFVERPCIDIGKDNNVNLVLVGASRLYNSGIRVPESSIFILEGKGDLSIDLGSADFHGIGNDLSSRHGELIFDQDGTLTIKSESHAGVCIGSGLGGVITMNRGRYIIKSASSSSTCIGAGEGDTRVAIVGCDIECSVSGAFCTGIGSIHGHADLSIMYSSLKLNCDSQIALGIGSLRGDRARVHIESMSLSVSVHADALAAFGALYGSSELLIEKSSVKTSVNGANALVFGGYNANTSLTVADVDFSAEVYTEMPGLLIPDIDGPEIKGGRYHILYNDKIYNRIF